LPPGAVTRLHAAQFGQDEQVSSAALSPDGTVVAADTTGGKIRLLDAATGRRLRQFTEAPLGRPSLTFSPDGSRLAFLDRSGHVRVWESGTGKEVRRLAPALGRIASFTFSADGKVLAGVAEGMGQAPLVHAWEIATGKELGRFAPLQNWQVGAALAADGKFLATWGQQVRRGERATNQRLSRTIQLWDLAMGKELHRLQAEDGPVQTACFAPDGSTLAAAGEDATVRIWQVATGKELRRFAGPEDLGSFFGFSPDGKILVAITTGGEVQRWNVATGKLAGSSQAPPGRFCSLAFLPHGKMLVLGIEGHQTRSWDLERQMLWLWEATSGEGTILGGGHQSGITSLAFLTNGKLIASAGGDGKLCLWEAATGRQLRQVPFADEDISSGTSIAFSPDGRFLASASRTRIHLHDVATGNEVRSFGRHLTGVESIAFSADGSLLIAGTRERTLCLWDMNTGRELRRWNGVRGDWLGITGQPLALSSDGRTLATVGSRFERTNDGLEVCEIRLWEAMTGKAARTLKPAGFSEASLAFSPNGGLLAAVGYSAGSLWDVAAGKELLRFATTELFSCPAVFSPDGRTLAIAEYERETKEVHVGLYETASGKLRRELKGLPRDAAVTCLAFSGDGKRLATGLPNGTVVIWDVTGRLPSRDDPKRRPSPQELQALWSDLAVEDADIGYRAILRLTAAPGEAVALLRQQLRPVEAKDVDESGIARLIALLDDDDFAVREEASRELRRLGAKCRPALVRALAKEPVPEVRRRAEQLLDKLGDPDPAWEMLRPLRALEVLEHLGTPEARAVLERLAQGKPDAQLTREARAILERLAKHARPSKE
jgi:WD40 repeat protein